MKNFHPRPTAIIIPALNPDEGLIKYIEELIDNSFSCIIIIDDGSTQNTCVFEQLESFHECRIIHHAVNMGKGRALKDAFNYYLIHFSKSYVGVICADSDGQHTVPDVIRLSDSLGGHDNTLILGVRDFDSDNVPPKSKFGNKITKGILKFFYGGNISDTQTGLRAIPNRLLYTFLTLAGERFEYETTMLIDSLKRKINIKEIKISTVYLDSNSGTHFRPIADSWAIYKLIFGTFFKYLLSAGSSSLLDLGIFGLISFILKYNGLKTQIWVATTIARACSSLYNYSINKNLVFENDASVQHTLLKYYTLCIIQMCCSALGVYGLCHIAIDNVMVSKIIVDSILFIISFQIQRVWIFGRDD